MASRCRALLTLDALEMCTGDGKIKLVLVAVGFVGTEWLESWAAGKVGNNRTAEGEPVAQVLGASAKCKVLKRWMTQEEHHRRWCGGT